MVVTRSKYKDIFRGHMLGGRLFSLGAFQFIVG